MNKDPHCYWCGIEVINIIIKDRQGSPANMATIDHLYTRREMTKRLEALRKGDGSHFVLACWECNNKRSNPKEWLSRKESSDMT